MKNDPEFARAVAILSAHEGPWDTFMRGLRTYQATSITSLVNAPENEIFVAQGRARAMSDILAAIDAHRSVLDRSTK